MSFVWFSAACVLLLLWLIARSSLKKELEATERRRKEAFELWESRKQSQEKAMSLAEELIKTQTRIDDLRAKVGTLTYESTKFKTERDQLQTRFARIEGLGALEDAITYAARLHDTAEEQMYDAKKEVARLIGEAEEQARQIAGAAYDIAQREGELKRTVRALENTINGYGDAYLIPTSSLMDELEERYGFADAGKRLKDARQLVSNMIKQGTAASCDYVEKNRKDTAIAFVLDAFNGKVATALSAVKSDNFGKLEQKLKDAFQLVNFHGEAFRNARIEPAFFEAQVNVLRWAVAVQELRRQEQEEQRVLREEMREEEKARKEYERALKQSARDEQVARKAVDDVRHALLEASDAERQKLEAQLAALTEKLLIAEEQGKRALSMAQQTRVGTVYVISNVGSFGEDVFKIGMTRRLEPLDRVKELGDASVPFSFDVHALIRTDDAPTLEKELHKVFVRNQVNKVNARKEFFKTPLSQIRTRVEQMGIEASWTMAAACTEWRETAAIEKELAAEGVAAKRWEEKQVRMEAVGAE